MSDVFEPIGTAMIRVPIWPTDRLAGLTGFRSPEDTIPSLWGDAEFRRAVRISSARLGADADWAVSPAARPGKRLRGVGLALLRYAIRMASRPTPFGAFAAVGTVRVGTATTDVRIERFRPRFRIGAGAAQEIVRSVERDHLERLEVMVNPTAHRRADRWELLVNAAQDRDTAHDLLSVRWTAAVEKVATLAIRPVPVVQVIESLAAGADDDVRPRVEAFVRTLLERGFLVSSARPSLTDAGPVDRVRPIAPIAASAVALLAEGDVDEGTVQQLVDVLDRASGTADGAGAETQEAVQVDVAADVVGGVSDLLVRRVARAADALTVLSPVPARSPELREWSTAFRERYGRDEVPLLEALDELLGLGFPHGYPGSDRPAPDHEAERWEVDLAQLRRRLSGRAVAVDGVPRAELTDADLEPLRARPARVPASLDVFALVGSGSEPDAVTIAPVGATPHAGGAFGRFAGVIDGVDAVQRVAGAVERDVDADVLFCHVDYLNPRPHMNNVAFAPQQFEHVIPVTSTAHADSPGTVPLAEIVVGWSDGLTLRHGPTGRRIVCRNPNILNRQTQPGLVRFLLDVSDDGEARPGWSWGEHEEHVDVLPRVVFEDVVVAPAQWRLPPLDGDPETDTATLRAWRRAEGVPQSVFIGVYDNRLLLDLEDDLQAEVLLREHRSGVAWVQEGPADLAAGVVTGPDGRPRTAELVVPLRRRLVERRPALPTRSAPRRADAAVRERCAPGVEWWSLRIAGRRKDQDTVLRELSGLCTQLGAEFFFVRYGDPVEHLRFRVRSTGSTEAITPILESAGAMLDAGRVSDVSIRGYDREVARYGGPEHFPAVEALFCRTAPPTIGLLAELPRADVRPAPGGPDRATVGAAVLDAFFDGFGLPDDERRWVVDGMVASYAAEFGDDGHALRRTVQRARATQRPLLLGILRRSGSVEDGQVAAAASLAPHRAALAEAVGPAGATLAAAVLGLGAESAFGVLSSLVHMQANRMGYGREEEYQALLALKDVMAASRRSTDLTRGAAR